MSTLNRAYAFLEIKSIDEDQRIIEGIASTPTTDRLGDIVQPLGAKFKLPMPFLWQHNSREPLGHVVWAKPNKDGIPFKAKLVKSLEPGTLKDRLDEAWQSIKLGLVRAVSIGFAPIKYAFMDDGGTEFQEWQWLELSAVTIPANEDATMNTIRSIDRLALGASEFTIVAIPSTGDSVTVQATPIASKSIQPAGASASKSIKLKEAAMARKTNAERIQDLEAKRAAEAAAREEIQTKVSDEGRTKDEIEQQAFDDHSATIVGVDRELADCRLLEKENMAAAKPVVQTAQGSVDVRSPIISVRSPVPPGIGMARMLIAKMHAHKHQKDASLVAKQFWPNNPEIELAIKAAEIPGDTTTTHWATELVYAQNLASEFLEFLTPQVLLGQIPGFTRVPFNIRVPIETSVISAQWVGEGHNKPVAQGSFDTMTLRWAKTACILGFTDELARFSNPSVEMLVRNNLAKGIAKFLDEQFFTPSVVAVSNVSPASITNGAATAGASGTAIANVITDAKAAFGTLTAANISTSGAVFAMRPATATSIGLMMNPLGQRQFPDVNADGGSLMGYRVFTSNNIPSGDVVFFNPSDIFVADDGGLTVDISREASVQMDSNPTSGEHELVSAWQQNLVFVRAERYITWARARTAAVYVITGAAYA